MTNYSINKESENFEQNTDPNSPEVGLKIKFPTGSIKSGSGVKVDADQSLEVSLGKLRDREETNMGQRSKPIDYQRFTLQSNKDGSDNWKPFKDLL